MKKLFFLLTILTSITAFAQNGFVGDNSTRKLFVNDTAKFYKQAQYQANYGSTFNIRSLVDKGYVDSSRNKARDSVVALLSSYGLDANVVHVTGAETISGTKIFNSYTQHESGLSIAQSAIGSSAPSGHVWLYAKNDGLLYGRDDAGVETKLSNDGSNNNHFFPIASFYTDANNSGSALTDLYTCSIAGSTLLNNGDYITATFGVDFNSATNGQITIEYGGSGSTAPGTPLSGNQYITARVIIIRSSSTTARMSIEIIGYSGNVLGTFNSTVTGLDFTTLTNLKLQGQASASNQITAKNGIVSAVKF